MPSMGRQDWDYYYSLPEQRAEALAKFEEWLDHAGTDQPGYCAVEYQGACIMFIAGPEDPTP